MISKYLNFDFSCSGRCWRRLSRCQTEIHSGEYISLFRWIYFSIQVNIFLFIWNNVKKNFDDDDDVTLMMSRKTTMMTMTIRLRSAKRKLVWLASSESWEAPRPSSFSGLYTKIQIIQISKRLLGVYTSANTNSQKIIEYKFEFFRTLVFLLLLRFCTKIQKCTWWDWKLVRYQISNWAFLGPSTRRRS